MALGPGRGRRDDGEAGWGCGRGRGVVRRAHQERWVQWFGAAGSPSFGRLRTGFDKLRAGSFGRLRAGSSGTLGWSWWVVQGGWWSTRCGDGWGRGADRGRGWRGLAMTAVQAMQSVRALLEVQATLAGMAVSARHWWAGTGLGRMPDGAGGSTGAGGGNGQTSAAQEFYAGIFRRPAESSGGLRRELSRRLPGTRSAPSLTVRSTGSPQAGLGDFSPVRTSPKSFKPIWGVYFEKRAAWARFDLPARAFSPEAVNLPPEAVTECERAPAVAVHALRSVQDIPYPQDDVRTTVRA